MVPNKILSIPNEQAWTEQEYEGASISESKTQTSLPHAFQQATLIFAIQSKSAEEEPDILLVLGFPKILLLLLDQSFQTGIWMIVISKFKQKNKLTNVLFDSQLESPVDAANFCIQKSCRWNKQERYRG